MNYAVVDAGSNTVRLSIYRYENDAIEPILTQKETLGLAQYISGGVMEEEGVDRLVETLLAFKSIALKFMEEPCLAVFATAAMRGSANRDDVARTIARRTGLAMDIISGEEEARLDYVGVAHMNPCGDGLILDIGGASAELVCVVSGQPSAMTSIPIGSLSLYKLYIKKILPKKGEYEAIKAAVREQFDVIDRKDSPNDAFTYPVLIGVGGTMRALERLLRYHCMVQPSDVELPVETALNALKMLRKNTPGILEAVLKTSPERIPTLIPGLMIFREAVKRYGCERFIVSPYGVREGYLIDRMLMRDNKRELTHATG